MDIKLIRKPNETELQYFKRIIWGKLVDHTINDDWEDLSEILFGEGNCFNSSEVRKRAYGAKRVLELLDEEQLKTLELTDVLTELDAKKIEIQKERYRLNDARSAFNSDIKGVSRWEELLERIESALEKRPFNYNSVIKKEIKSHNLKVGVLAISDFHYGKEFEIKGLLGETINKYSVRVFEERMWEIYTKTLDLCEKENLDVIYVIALGDFIENALRVSSYKSLQMGVIDATIAFADFLSFWLHELSKHVVVNYVQVSGNHDEIRLNGIKARETPEENVGKIISKVIETSLKDDENFFIIKNQANSNIAYFELLGTYRCVGLHEIRDHYSAIKDYETIYKYPIDYIFTGHEHFGNSQNVAEDKEVLGIPSIVGNDDFSMKIKKSANSGAKFFVFEQGEGKNAVYDIKVK